MSITSRLILLFCAALTGGFVALQGVSVSYALEPEQYSTSTSLFWFAAGAVVGAPFWIPALIPSRYSFVLLVCRWGGAALLLFPATLFGSIVWHNISRSISGLGATPSALALGLVLTTACLGCMLVLTWPELKAARRRLLK